MLRPIIITIIKSNITSITDDNYHLIFMFCNSIIFIVILEVNRFLVQNVCWLQVGYCCIYKLIRNRLKDDCNYCIYFCGLYLFINWSGLGKWCLHIIASAMQLDLHYYYIICISFGISSVKFIFFINFSFYLSLSDILFYFITVEIFTNAI